MKIDFENEGSNNEYDHGTEAFTALEAGTYILTSSASRFKPKNPPEFETIENKDRKWWQLWKPRMVTREIFDRVTFWDELEKKLEKGEVIEPFTVLIAKPKGEKND